MRSQKIPSLVLRGTSLRSLHHGPRGVQAVALRVDLCFLIDAWKSPGCRVQCKIQT